MSTFSASNPFENIHKDVLESKPEDDEGKARLVEELKSRAKKEFAQKYMPAAERLWSRAIELVPDATLHANRSAARLQMGKIDDALADANAAVKLDPAYSKAFYRQGQACDRLKRYAEAIGAYEAGLKLEPDSKVFKGALAKAQEAKRKLEDEPPPLEPARDVAPSLDDMRAGVSSFDKSAAPAGTTRVTAGIETDEEFKQRMAKTGGPVATGPMAKTSAPAAPRTANWSSGDAGEDGEGGEKIRGYKLDSQGRKTTFFNNELSDEAKALIGDIAPKKIATADEAKLNVTQGNSAWNQGGTWEETSRTPWAKERIPALLEGLSFELPTAALAGADAAFVPGTAPAVWLKEVSKVAGDASINRARGRTKHIFDLRVECSWQMPMAAGLASGSLIFPDVSGDAVDDGELEAEVTVDKSSPRDAASFVDAFVKNPSQGLVPVAAAELKKFAAELRAMT